MLQRGNPYRNNNDGTICVPTLEHGDEESFFAKVNDIWVVGAIANLADVSRIQAQNIPITKYEGGKICLRPRVFL